jgi:hypothetical protein
MDVNGIHAFKGESSDLRQVCSRTRVGDLAFSDARAPDRA